METIEAFTIDPGFLITCAIILLLVFFVLKGLIIVKQAQTIIIERLGKYHRLLQSGINITIPFIDRPRPIHWRVSRPNPSGIGSHGVSTLVDRIDLRETVYDFPRQGVITKDNVSIDINALIYFQVTDPFKSVYEIANLPDAIEKLTQTTLRNIIGELDLDGCLVSRDTINSRLTQILDAATNKWGVKVTRVELQDITPPKDIQEAMEKQMRAERARRAVILEAEGDKKSAILQAEGVKESEINRAEGDKQSAILRAHGEAEARIQVAMAEAEVIQKITAALAETPQTNPANYLIAVRYLETLREMVSGKDNKTIFMPYEASGILSSIGGIKEMLTENNLSRFRPAPKSQTSKNSEQKPKPAEETPLQINPERSNPFAPRSQ